MSMLAALALIPRQSHIDIAFLDDEERLVVLTQDRAFRISIREDRPGTATVSMWVEERDPLHPTSIPGFHRPPLVLKTTSASATQIVATLQAAYGLQANEASKPPRPGQAQTPIQAKAAPQDRQPTTAEGAPGIANSKRSGRGHTSGMFGMLLLSLMTAIISVALTMLVMLKS